MDVRSAVTDHRSLKVLGLVLAALALKAVFFYSVAMNADTGLFLYDAKQVLWGRQMFVDFPSRSPIFHYLLAGIIPHFESTVIAGRLMMTAGYLLLGLAVYGFARQLHSHAAGLVALALYYFTPYSFVWSYWVKTEVVLPLFIILAFAPAIHIIDRDHFGYLIPAFISFVLFVALFIRRSAIIFIGAFGIWVLFYRWKYHDRDWREPVRMGVWMNVVLFSLLIAAYLYLGRGELATAYDIADQHLIQLFTSDGSGVLSWTAIERTKAITAHEGGRFLSIICQKCGANTVSVFSRTIMLSLPVLVIMLAFLRSYLLEGSEWVADTFFPTAMIVIAVVRVGVLLQTDHAERILTVVVFILAIGYIWWKLKPLDWQAFWDPRYGLLTASLLALAFGYLYRDRILYVTYWQDFYPFLAILAGITAVELYRRNEFTPTVDAPIISIILAGALIVAAFNAYPVLPGDDRAAQNNWFTVKLVQEYGDDLEARTDPGDPVYAAQPLYVVDADRKLVANLSRKYYAFQGWPESDATKRVERQLIAAFSTGRAEYAVISSESLWTLNTSEGVRETLTANYCRVPSADELYNKTGSRLYRYSPNTQACHRYNHTDPRANTTNG